jgi:hypothetical protein
MRWFQQFAEEVPTAEEEAPAFRNEPTVAGQDDDEWGVPTVTVDSRLRRTARPPAGEAEGDGAPTVAFRRGSEDDAPLTKRADADAAEAAHLGAGGQEERATVRLDRAAVDAALAAPSSAPRRVDPVALLKEAERLRESAVVCEVDALRAEQRARAAAEDAERARAAAQQASEGAALAEATARSLLAIGVEEARRRMDRARTLVASARATLVETEDAARRRS